MRYDIKAIETKFKGYTFRSRLEARWAATFELLGWEWDYEPVDFKGWSPDFGLYYSSSVIYVEVKPVLAFPTEVAHKIERSGCLEEVLIVGQKPYFPIDREWCSAIGWLGGVLEGCWHWDEAMFGSWADGEVGFTSWQIIWGNRMGPGCKLPRDNYILELDEIWARAHYLTRYMNPNWLN